MKRMEIARPVAQVYGRLEGVDWIAVSGSTARGNADEYSDLEMWATGGSLPDLAARMAVLSGLSDTGHAAPREEAKGGMTRPEAAVISGVAVYVTVGSNNDLLSVGLEIDKNLGTPMEAAIADFHDLVVLHDPKGLYRTVKQRLDDYPVMLGTKVIGRLLQEIVDLCANAVPRAFRSQNWMELLHARSAGQEALLRIAFVLNRDYFPRVKDADWLLDSMAQLPEGFAERMRLNAREESIRVARVRLIALARDLVQLARDVWPEPLSETVVAELNGIAEELGPLSP